MKGKYYYIADQCIVVRLGCPVADLLSYEDEILLEGSDPPQEALPAKRYLLFPVQIGLVLMEKSWIFPFKHAEKSAMKSKSHIARPLFLAKCFLNSCNTDVAHVLLKFSISCLKNCLLHLFCLLYRRKI